MLRVVLCRLPACLFGLVCSQLRLSTVCAARGMVVLVSTGELCVLLAVSVLTELSWCRPSGELTAELTCGVD